MTAGFWSDSLRIVARVSLLSLGIAAATVRADAWFDTGDPVLRHDLQFLTDSGAIDLPVTAWPIPSNDLAQALERADQDRQSLSAGQLAVLRRLERRLAVFRRESTRTSVHLSAAGNPAALRGFENTPREEGEVGGTFSVANSRFSARLAVSAVSDPEDDKSLRLDGSYATARVGNWLLTAGALDRWWGPGWDGSLILSNNARPIPALSLDRESSAPFESKWLSWLGPWRLNTFMGRMESERTDVASPLLFGARFTFRPARLFEAGLVRTAQWCGSGRPCGANIFWNVLTGNDNAGPGETLDPEDEPGNQLAGYDMRFTSPWDWLPLVVYRQTVGEDLNSNNLPSGRLTQWGAESWHAFQKGGLLRLHLEYADTICSGSSDNPIFDCAYNNHIFSTEGYRYRGRPIGHSADGDSRLYSGGLRFTAPSAWSASLLFHWGRLNRGGNVPDVRNTLAREPTDLRDIEATFRMRLERGELRLGAGFDERTTLATDDSKSETRGFVEWRRDF